MITFLVIITVVWLISKKSNKIFFLKNKIIQQPFNYYLLIVLLIIGFIFRLDYTNQFGCIVTSEPVFELKNILYSSISIVLALLSFIVEKRTHKLLFMLYDTLFWIVKLFLYKGGYAVGITGEAGFMVSLYDTTVLALRFFIIKSILKVHFNQVYILIFTMIIMTVKIYIFPLPYSFYIEEREFTIDSERMRYFLTRFEWIEISDTSEKVRIAFNNNSAIAYNLYENKDSVLFVRVYWFKDEVHLESESFEYMNFEFYEEGKDTINVKFLNFGFYGENNDPRNVKFRYRNEIHEAQDEDSLDVDLSYQMEVYETQMTKNKR